MLISALTPSRGRPASLRRAVTSLLDTADNPDQVEVLIALDPDDDTAPAAAGLAAFPAVRFWTAPERYGYHGLHRYCEHLAATATGKWLLLWNDDAVMQTRGWDTIIASHAYAVLWPQSNVAPGCCTFPVWPRAWMAATGHLSPSAHIDTYLQYLGEGLGALVKIPVEIFHDRADVTGGHDDETYREGRGRIGSYGMVPGFDGAVMRERVVQDVLTIEQTIKERL